MGCQGRGIATSDFPYDTSSSVGGSVHWLIWDGSTKGKAFVSLLPARLSRLFTMQSVVHLPGNRTYLIFSCCSAALSAYQTNQHWKPQPHWQI